MNKPSKGLPGPDLRLPDALLSPHAWPGGGDVELVETHISWVFLVGALAYKVKKPVRLDFLDFSTPRLRRHFCAEELRLNRRFAPELYLGLSRIVETPDGLAVGVPGRLVETAVRMRRFDRRDELDALVEREAISVDELAAFGAGLAALHETSPQAAEGRPWATPRRTLQACRENFAELRRVADDDIRQQVLRLADWTEQRYLELEPSLLERREAGRFRECHGDLHCGNLVRYDGRLCAFDALEFDPGLHWIDVASDLAFLYMDLRARGRADLAAALLDSWLARSGDFAALAPLRFYEVYRACVRAKVAAIRMSQDATGRAARLAELTRYLAAANSAAVARSPMLVVMGGLSGTGKSRLAGRLLAPLEAIRIRSDVERKRMAGLAADADSGGSIYSPEMTRRTYQRLRDLAGDSLCSGFSVIIDAANLLRSERDSFRALARELNLPCRILWLTAPAAMLRERIAGRAAAGGDPSEADLSVLDLQSGIVEPPASDEMDDTTWLDSSQRLDAQALAIDVRAAAARPAGTRDDAAPAS